MGDGEYDAVYDHRKPRALMAKSVPPMKWDVDAWLNDENLARCSSAARGVWSSLVSLMHRAGQMGQLRGTCDELAIRARCSSADMLHALTELRTTGAADVHERNGVVIVVNRRMSREARKRQLAADRQFKRRNGGASRESNADVIDEFELQERDVSISMNPSGSDVSDSQKDPLREEVIKRKRFQKPSVEEVRSYCAEKGYKIDAEYFVAFYEANGWVQGKSSKPVRNWRMCLFTWSRNKQFGGAAGGFTTKDDRNTAAKDELLNDLFGGQ